MQELTGTNKKYQGLKEYDWNETVTSEEKHVQRIRKLAEREVSKKMKQEFIRKKKEQEEIRQKKRAEYLQRKEEREQREQQREEARKLRD